MNIFSQITEFFRKQSEIKTDPEVQKILDRYEERKKIKIIRKDDFDEKHGSLVECGFLEPIEYYRLKALYLENGLSY